MKSWKVYCGARFIKDVKFHLALSYWEVKAKLMQDQDIPRNFEIYPVDEYTNEWSFYKGVPNGIVP